MTIKQLERKALAMRQDVIKMLHVAQSGHTAASLDLADIFSALYFDVLKHDPKRPLWSLRDRLFLSCGHACPIRYVAMMHAGYISKSYMNKLRKFGSPLQGHPSIDHIRALEHSSGSLGQGLSVAAGSAYASRVNNKNYFVYCIMGDGEQQEGQIWEAAMFAAKNKLGNLIGIIDRNHIQIDGYTENVMPLEQLREKYEAFHWHVLEADGHNIEEFIDACNMAKTLIDNPTVIIAHTIAGKGVKYMEYDPKWHGRSPKTDEEERRALRDLHIMGRKIV